MTAVLDAEQLAALLGVWIDYSAGTVSGATMAANNLTGAIRYGGVGATGKRLSRAEYQDHTDHGRLTVLVVEKTTTDADGGAPAGKANAQAALADVEKITAGLPPIGLVLMANDKPTFVQADIDYVGAAADVFAGGALVGPYGFGSDIAACAHAGLAPIGWQAGPAPSRTGTAQWATWWQRNGGPAAAADGPASPTTLVLDDVICDASNQLKELAVPLSAADIAAVAHAVAAYKDPGNTKDVDMHQHGADATAALAVVKTMAVQLNAIEGSITADEATLLAAFKAGADPVAFAKAAATLLAPALTQVSAEDIGAALVQELRALLGQPNPTS